MTKIPDDLTTREFCSMCGEISRVGFHASDAIWEAVAGRHKHDILCLSCFAKLGDEKYIAWEGGLIL